MKKILMILGGALLISVLGGVGGGLIFKLMQPPPVPQGAEAEEQVKAEEATTKEEPVETRTAIYFEIHPAFVVNIGSTERTRFLQIDVVVMGYEQRDIKAFEEHIPAVRNDLLLLFSNQDAEDLLTSGGKTRLREKSLEVVRAAMLKKYGKPAIEDIFFTKLVVQ